MVNAFISGENLRKVNHKTNKFIVACGIKVNDHVLVGFDREHDDRSRLVRERDVFR